MDGHPVSGRKRHRFRSPEASRDGRIPDQPGALIADHHLGVGRDGTSRGQEDERAVSGPPGAPLHTLSRCDLPWAGPIHRRLPQVLTVGVPLVRREDHGLTIRGEVHVLHLEGTGGEGRRFSSSRGHAVQIGEAVPLPGEDESVPRRPKDRVVGRDALKQAPGSLRRREGRPGPSRGHVGHSETPGHRLAHRDERKAVSLIGDTEEGQSGPVRRPDRASVQVQARVQVRQVAGVERIYADEGMVPSSTGPGQTGAVG